MAECKLVVFDWDGTLMDSEARIVTCLEAAINDVGLSPREPEVLSNIIGLGLREAVDNLFPGIGEEQRASFVDRYRYHFLSGGAAPSRLFTGATQTLQELSDYGYFLAIATGKGRHGLDKALGESGLAHFFHSTRCADESRSKPDPQMLEQILDELGVFPAEAVMVGDTEYDMLMAVNAGVKPIGVSYGVHAAERLHKHQPLAVLDEISQLPVLLQDLL